jgi:uncharacterized protein (DUF486 family)
MMEMSRRQNVVLGHVLILVGLLAVVDVNRELSPWAWVIALAAAGAVAFGFFLAAPGDWGLLISAYVLEAVAGLIALVELSILQDEIIATYVLAAIALPFAVVFLRDRAQWWAAIPAYALLAVGVMVGLIGQGLIDELLIPAYIMFAIAIPFLVVYGRDTRNWWALIPGGIMAAIGAAFLLAEAQAELVVPVLLMLVGIWMLVRALARRTPPA